jgi:hypothetical protein
MKMTNIEMEWTDDGARILSTMAIPCPACGVVVTPNVEHTCGDMADKKPKRIAKGGKAK